MYVCGYVRGYVLTKSTKNNDRRGRWKSTWYEKLPDVLEVHDPVVQKLGLTYEEMYCTLLVSQELPE